MFNKVLVAEDFQDTNSGIVNAIKKQLDIPTVTEELYCDKAYNRIKVAYTNNTPYELLITDLLFKEHHTDRKLRSGIELIDAIKIFQPDIKVIVNSMEDNPEKIKRLFEKQKIDGYVCKGRKNLNELIKAIGDVYQNTSYTSPQISLSSTNNVFEFDELDELILKELAQGLSKREIGQLFKQKNISPSSESTIDKRVSKLFSTFDAKNTTHLIAILTRDGLI